MPAQSNRCPEPAAVGGAARAANWASPTNQLASLAGRCLPAAYQHPTPGAYGLLFLSPAALLSSSCREVQDLSAQVIPHVDSVQWFKVRGGLAPAAAGRGRAGGRPAVAAAATRRSLADGNLQASYACPRPRRHTIPNLPHPSHPPTHHPLCRPTPVLRLTPATLWACPQPTPPSCVAAPLAPPALRCAQPMPRQQHCGRSSCCVGCSARCVRAQQLLRGLPPPCSACCQCCVY